jgi:hypothetical protein
VTILQQVQEQVTWVKVDPPTLDLVGLVLGAFSLAGVLVGIAFGLGILFGLLRILHARSRSAWGDRLSLFSDVSPTPPQS